MGPDVKPTATKNCNRPRGGICLALYAFHQRKDLPHPFIRLSLARRWNFLLGLIGTLPLQISAGLSGVLVPAYLIAVRHFGPEQIATVVRQGHTGDSDRRSRTR